MKRRVLSFILILTLCLNLCPVWALAADAGTDDGLCPHHLAHTDACGYVPPAVGQECTHAHNEDCYNTETSCVHQHTAECWPQSDGDSETGEPTLCTHECTQESGCVTKTLSCSHIHDGSCGYAEGDPGEPCTFDCRICPIEDLLDKLPRSVSEDNSEQVQEQVSEIYALYDELTEDEQDQVDLSPCAALLEQLDGMGSAVLSAGSTIDLTKDMTNSLEASSTHTLRLNGHNVLPPESSTYAIRILGTGVLTIEGRGTISSKGVGVEVQSGGSLSIAEPDLCINGSMYALDIASGAKVQLSAGRYYSKSAPVIHTADGDYAALLAPGCAYFDADNSNKPIPLTDVAKAGTVIVDQCKDHLGESVTHKKGTPTHTWPCLYCGTEETEGCTFTFAEDGTGTCSKCGSTLEIFVDEDDLANLVYDGTIVPENVNITVTLTDGSNEKLVKDTDYTVTYEIHKDAGEITVTVTGITFEGTFTRTYKVNRDHPVLEWDTSDISVPVLVNYDGNPVEKGDLPSVKININASEDLHKSLQYSYKQDDSDYTSGLPTNVGTYEVIVSLPEMDNFEAAVSEPITLTINPIDPIVTFPVATNPTFNRTEQELVTAGKLCDVAVRDGIEIQFATSKTGPYTTTIPTGTNAGSYDVWYKVEDTDNYNAVEPTKINDVKILRKPIKPDVKLSQYSYLYDGGYKQPTVTVVDASQLTTLPDSEYQVEYKNNRDVGKAKVIVTDKAGGNYNITPQVEVEFEITARTQDSLSITNQPNTFTYGDKFTLGTSGGSGNGKVTWGITDGTDVAKIDANSGQVTIIGDGSATVKATKSGKDPVDDSIVNYEDATASWTFTADKKPVTATVTADDKDYNGDATATVHAVVEQGVLPGDEITITGLTGTFDNANAGANKPVTVVTTGAAITGQNSEHYDVSYSNAPVQATIRKAVAKITTAPVPANLTYNGTAQVLIGTGAVVDPADVPVEYALSETGPYSTDFPKATNAGTYTVWYRIQETNNYTGLAPASVDVTIAKKSAAPTITLSENTFTYDGTAKEPTVTLTEADGTTEIPANEYTVAYSNNTDVGTATVTVTAKADGNYEFTPDTTVTKDFTINKVQAQVLTAPEAAGDPLIFSNRDQKLVTAGTGSGGTMVYSVNNENGTYSADIPTGINAAEYTVYYKVQGDANHSDSAIGSVKVTIAPKTVKDPTIELFDENDVSLVSYTYDGSAKEPKAVVKDGSDVIGGTEYNVIYSDNINAGKATVNITDKPGGNYIVSGSATFVIGKADIEFKPEPSAANITYDGKPQELLVPGKTSGGTVLYALNSATSTYGDAIPTATEAGDYTVYYKVVGDTNHNDFAVKSVPVTIKRKSLTNVTIELTPNSFEYDGTEKMPAVTVKDGKTVLPAEEYTWTCENTSPKNQGTYTIIISDAADGNYDLTGVTNNTATFSIGMTAQKELVIEGKPDATIYGDTFTLSTSGGSSSSAVTWSVAGTAATVDEMTGEVKITGVGEVTITATNPGDNNYEPVSAQWTFTAAPKPVTASITVASRAYDGTTAATVASAGITTLNSDTVTIDPASITAAFDSPSAETGKTVTLDTSKVQVIGDDAAKYEISYPDTVTADITKATTTVTKEPKEITSLTYTGQPQALVTAGKTNVGFLVYSLNGTDFSPEIPTRTNAGTYNVYYKVDGTSDYTEVAVNATPISVTIDPKTITPTVTLLPVSFVYDGTKKEPVIMVKDGDTVIDQNQYTVTWAKDGDSTATNMLTDVGTYTATISAVANGNYSFTVTDKVEIIPAVQNALEITGKPAHVYYGDTITTLSTAGGTGNGTVTWSITAGKTNSSIEANTGKLTVKDTGSITVTAVRTVPNYGDVSADWTFTVEPKPVMAEVTITDKVYDGTNRIADANITAAVKADDLVDSTDNFTISRLTGTYDDANAGTNKTVTLDATNATKEDRNGKYIVSYPATAKGNITPKPVTVTVTLSGDYLNKNDDGTYYYEYDGTEKKPTVTVTADDGATLAPSDYDVIYSNNKNVTSETTKATVTVTAKADGNYTFTGVTENFKILKADATLTLPPQPNNLTYTGQPQALVSAGTATGGHIEYLQDDNTYSKDIPKETEAGTYTVYYKVVGDSNHSDSVTRQVSVTIQPKEVINPKITVDGTYTYNGNAQEPGEDKVTVKDGTKTIEATEYTLSYRDNINAGTATVIVTNANGGNYIVNGTATFVIAKASATVTTVPAPQTLSYNGTAQELVTAGSASGGTMVYSLGQTGEYSTAIPTGKTVGSYTVYYKVQGDSNHEDSTAASVTASIIKNNVTQPTIQVTPESVTYNGNKQEPRVSVKDDNGLAIDGSEYTVTYLDKNNNSDLIKVGKYTLTITGVTDGNYTFDDTDGKNTAEFEILPADQTPLTITGTRERVCYGDTIQLGTTGGSGTVTWKVDDVSIADISTNGLLEIKGVGPVTVTATSTAPGYTDQTATWSFHADKKSVTADVTAEAKAYDGNKTATVTATLQSSDLVGSDKVNITLSGSFEDPNVGTDKKVNVDSTNPTVTGNNADKYAITYPATTTASILKANVTDVAAPTAATGLTYTGQPQALVTAGTATGGIMEYSLDGKTYSVSLPTGTDAGDYDIWYRVKGDGNHNDTAAKQLIGQVTIAPQEVTNPTIEFTPSGASYDGREHKPSVTVKDAHNRVIPAEEYTVTYDPTGDWTKAGKYEVKVTDKNGGNYTITEAKKEFAILAAGQSPLSITNKPGKVQYGDSFTLSAVGGSITGAVTWESSPLEVASIDNNGLVTVHKAGSVTITAKKLADGNYSEVSDTWSFNAEKKPVTPIVTARDKEYDQTNKAELDITWKDGDLLNSDTIDLKDILTGQFEDTNVGTNKKVTIIGTSPVDERYTITIPRSTTAAITPKAASVTGSTNPTLTYTGSAQGLISGITAENGTLAFSRDGSYYTLTVPEEKNAGTYPVWYKAQADPDGNYKDSPAVRVNVTIKPKEVTSPGIELSPETFEYDGTPKKPDVVVKDGSTVIPSSEYTVSYSSNTAVGTATVTISDADGGNYIVSGTAQFTIEAATASLIDAPEPKDLTYNGSAQALVTAGTAENGRVVYSTDENGPYTASIPKGTDAKTYQVWYKVEGKNGASGTTPESVSVEIKRKQVNPTILLNNQLSYSTPYTGSAITPSVSVFVDGQQLMQNVSTTYSGNINVGTATVIVQSTGGNYQFFAIATFEITKSKAQFSSKPVGNNLYYTGEAQKLVSAGTSNDGVVLYSLDSISYSALIPTGVERGTYSVLAKVQGDSTHEDSDIVTITAEIGTNEVKSPTVTLSQGSFNYTGSEHRPTVTVEDDNGHVIPASEYTVAYSDNINVGEATVTVTSKGNNYSFTATKTFQIVGADQSLLEITGKKDTVYYGDTLTLGTTGGSGTGTVTWKSSDTNVAAIDETTGAVTIKKSGSVTITASKAAGDGYGATTAEWTFIAQPKPITAVVTAANKPYDGDTKATLTVTLTGLLIGDSISINTDGGVKAEGVFMDENVGTNKTVIISMTIPNDVKEKYDISYPSITTASITPKAATVLDTDKPTIAGSLTYNGSEQPLLTSGGIADGGNLAYSLDGISYSFNVPTGTDAGKYTVWYKVVASDENHKDSAVTKLGNVTISVNTDTPSVLCTPSTFQYDGTEKTPTVVVRDSAQRVIPESEYTVAFDAGRIAVGTYKVTVTDKTGGNYEFTSSVEGSFEIVSASQNPLSIVTDKATDVYYGDTFRLSAMGGSGSGAIKWSIKENNGVATINDNGVVTVTGTGGFTVKAYREATDGYSQSNTDSVPFVANPKPVTPVVTAVDKPYDGNTNAALTASWKSGDLVNGDTIDLTVTGQFVTSDVGTSKRVNITSHGAAGTNAGKYAITWPDSTTASIYKVDAKLATAPTGKTLTHTGNAQELVTPGTTVNNIGTIVYSLSQDGVYSEDIPKGITAGDYTVWYKVPDSVNYTGIPAASIEVTIRDTTRSTNNASMRTTVQNGTANTVLNAAAGRKLVNEAAAAQSDSIVIKPEITSDVTKAQVSIPASTVSQIKNETNAALTVSAPIADVTIPNAALDTLSSAGGTVNVVTEQVDQAVVLTLTADGKSVESVPGGVTLTVPAEDAGPGTVAVLVHEDGTRETVRKSVAEDGKVNIPLDGSATVEIVDNSKDFDDVPDTSWASDAVDFASAHELFNGTSETTFSPDQPMSRGMLATVLYNLEGSPAQEQASGFSDVSSDAWYADGVAWAAENGIADGYGDGQFGPEESITREQFVVMLWKYAGSPQASEQTLAFEDADQVSDYAQEALCWAVESGILNGVGEGQLAPGGTATRAQAAQMLKRFMENG